MICRRHILRLHKGDCNCTTGYCRGFTEIIPAKLNRSGWNLAGKHGLMWDTRLENFSALSPTAARWRRKNKNFFVRTSRYAWNFNIKRKSMSCHDFFSYLQNFTDKGSFTPKNLNFGGFFGTLPVTGLSACPDNCRANLIVESDNRRAKGVSSSIEFFSYDLPF